jgi:hypothetical protein
MSNQRGQATLLYRPETWLTGVRGHGEHILAQLVVAKIKLANLMVTEKDLEQTIGYGLP